MMPCDQKHVLWRVSQAKHVWLFLDYDGTLADFAATPDEIQPDEALIALIEKLVARLDMQVTIISGRRLAHIQALLPVDALFRVGTYGLELQTSSGETIHRVDYHAVRPLLDDLRREWEQLLGGRSGFYLEDKGWTLAIHAKDATPREATAVLREAHLQASTLIQQEWSDIFRIQGGHRFLECGPRSADKRTTVEYLLTTYPWYDDALLIYLGDDDKDEVAFKAIQQHGGIAVAVGDRLHSSSADCWLAGPWAARQWLETLLETRSASEAGYQRA